jgi:ATP-dependent DNA ligase
LVKALDNPLIKITPQARTSVEKRQLWESVSDGRHEGIVLKRRDAPYCEGRTKNVLKVKHVKTIDCVVMELGRGGANNAVLGLFRNGGLVEVGQCSMIGKPACVVGEVVEIHCLYATSSHRLYQPRLVRLRPDRTAESCEWRQVEGIVTNRAVVGA